jgi:hypothetical protein
MQFTLTRCKAGLGQKMTRHPKSHDSTTLYLEPILKPSQRSKYQAFLGYKEVLG